MPNKPRGVGLFTAENIVAVIRAIPESDGTYRDVARKAQQYGGTVHYHTISNWVSHGRADVVAGQPSTAYARFTKRYRELIDEHCGPDTNRNREFDRALELDFAQNPIRAMDGAALGRHHMRQVPEGFSLSAVSPDI